MKRSGLLVYWFLAVSLAELLALAEGWQTVHTIAKPLIMISLLAYYTATVTKRSFIFICALIFCWTGDVFLLFQSREEFFFMGGLVAFLAGHVLYIMAYRQHQIPDRKEELMPTQKLRFSFPIVLAGTGLIVILFPSLGTLKIPVLIYAIVLMVMVITALFRFGRTSSGSFWMVLAGAALFMTSDSLLAINKFHVPFPFSGILIMITYIAAQYLIVEGIIKHERN